MARTLNEVSILGRVGDDPTSTITKNEKLIVNLSVATNEPYKKNEKWEQRTSWHKVVLFTYLAETAQKFIKKGSRVFVQGRLQYDIFTPENSDREIKITKIIANKLILLGDKRGTAQTSPPVDEDESVYYTANTKSVDMPDDEIPF